MLYRFINPSDMISFHAESDKIAYATTILVSNGRAGCEREDGTSLNCLFLFHPEPLADIREYLGKSLEDYAKDNRASIAKAMDSFAYGDVILRKYYDASIEAITDPQKLKEFKDQHEDRNRTSLTKWCIRAWQMAGYLRKGLENEN